MNNDKDFLDMVKGLQRKIDRDEEKTYSTRVIKEYRNPVNFGFIENPDATGQIKGPCNDTMRIDLRIKNNIIQDARFWTDGCGASLACGNMLMKMIKGKTLNDAQNNTALQLLKTLNGLPDEHQHCAKLAIHTLHETIKNYFTIER